MEHTLEPIVTTKSNQPKDQQGWAKVVMARIRLSMDRRRSWNAEARQALRYYRSDQYRLRRSRATANKDRVRMVANYIRRDVDQMVSSALDAEPIATTRSRQPKHHFTAKMMYEVAEWTRNEESDWESDLEDAIQDQFHIGEAAIYEGWNPNADEGRGMPEAQVWDSRLLFWDPTARKPQLDDAAWIIALEHVRIDDAKERFGLEDIQPQGPEIFMSPSLIDRYRARWGGGAVESAGTENADPKVWVCRMWEKVKTYSKRYYHKGERAYFMEGGELFPMTDRHYREGLDENQRRELDVIPGETVELWETTVVGEECVGRRLSPFDKSLGGHGEYPFGFYRGVRIRDESCCRGEIGFLIGISDVRNEVISMALDHALLANVGYLNVMQGSLPPEEEEKIPNIGYEPFTYLRTLAGAKPPEWHGVNPTGTQVFLGLLPTLDLIQNRESGVHEADRGQVNPRSDMSGRAIHALQARGIQLGVIQKRHIESGLRRCLTLRLHNISQLMRGHRVALSGHKDPDGRDIYMGHSIEEIAAFYNLSQEPDPENPQEMIWTANGKPVNVLPMGEYLTREHLFDRVKLTLDTNRERDREELRLEAEKVLQIGGPGLVPWYIRVLNLQEGDMAIEDLTKYNQGMQLANQLGELSKRSGMSPDEVMQFISQALAGQGRQITPQAALPPGGAV